MCMCVCECIHACVCVHVCVLCILPLCTCPCIIIVFAHNFTPPPLPSLPPPPPPMQPGGGCVFTTINRTQLSYLVAIVMAEYVLRAITPGTHEWHKFVTPQELTDMLCDSHMTVTCIKGMSYNPLSRTFSWSFSDAVNYLLYAVKPEEPL